MTQIEKLKEKDFKTILTIVKENMFIFLYKQEIFAKK